MTLPCSRACCPAGTRPALRCRRSCLALPHTAPPVSRAGRVCSPFSRPCTEPSGQAASSARRRSRCGCTWTSSRWGGWLLAALGPCLPSPVLGPRIACALLTSPAPCSHPGMWPHPALPAGAGGHVCRGVPGGQRGIRLHYHPHLPPRPDRHDDLQQGSAGRGAAPGRAPAEAAAAACQPAAGHPAAAVSGSHRLGQGGGGVCLGRWSTACWSAALALGVFPTGPPLLAAPCMQVLHLGGAPGGVCAAQVRLGCLVRQLDAPWTGSLTGVGGAAAGPHQIRERRAARRQLVAAWAQGQQAQAGSLSLTVASHRCAPTIRE